MLHSLRAALALVMVAGVTPASSHEMKLQNLHIVHPWAHGVANPGTTAPRDVQVYMIVFNRGVSADKLIGVASPLAESAELRNVAEPVQSIPFAPAAAVQLALDGPNIVLHGVTDDLAGYEAFPVWLIFEKAGRVEASVMVEDASVKAPTCSGSLMPSEMPAHDHAHTH